MISVREKKMQLVQPDKNYSKEREYLSSNSFIPSFLYDTVGSEIIVFSCKFMFSSFSSQFILTWLYFKKDAGTLPPPL